MSFLIGTNNQANLANLNSIPINEVIKFAPTKNKALNIFLRACYEGTLKDVKNWIKEKKSIVVTDKEGRTPLMLASVCNNEMVFNLIFNNTTPENLNALDKFRQNALHYACYSDRLNRVKLLRDKKVQVVCSAHESIPDTFTNNMEIKKLIEADCNKARDQQAAILQDVQEKYPDDIEKQMEEMYLRTGRKMQLFELSDLDKLGIDIEVINESMKDKFLAYPKTLEEVKETFKDEIPSNTDVAAKTLEEKFGFEIGNQKTIELLNESDITHLTF